MRIHPLYVLIFFASLFLMTLLIYPSQRDLAQLYLESGDIQSAKTILESTLTENATDHSLLITASEVYNLLGRPEKAITLLRQAQILKPRNVAMLTLLARYLEWDMRPKEALPIYEGIVAANPTRKDILRTLISHYRYFGMAAEESNTLARLLVQDTYPDNVRSLPLLMVLRGELTRLAEARLEGESVPLRDVLMQRLFIVGDQLITSLREGEKVSMLEYTTYCLEHYLRAGKLAEGAIFADRLDALNGGVETRLRFATVMRWNGLLRDALALLREVNRQTPGNETVLLALSSVARDLGDTEAVEMALEGLTDAVPDKMEYREQLAEVYLENNKITKAIELFDKLLASAVDSFRILGKLLTAALTTGKPDTMRLVLEKAQHYPTDRVDILNAKVELHMALDEPDKAYALLRTYADTHTPTHDQLVRVVEIALSTDTPPIIMDAVRLALLHEPDELQFMRQGAEALLGTDQSAEAFQLLKRVARKSNLESDTLTMLEAAGASGSPALVQEATAEAAALQPSSATVMDRAAEVFSWIEQPRNALPYAEKAARLSHGEKARIMKLIEIASFTGDPILFRNALVLAGKLRPDDSEIAIASAQALAAEGDTAAFDALINRFMASNKNAELIRKWATIADKAGLADQAFRLWYQVYKAAPSDAVARETVARLALDSGRYKIAATVWSDIADSRPASYAPAFSAGTAWAALGNVEKALGYFEKALELKPADRPTMLEVARNALYSGNYKRAVTLFEAYGVSQLQEEERFALAEAYGNTGEARKALELFSPLLKKDPLPKNRAIQITQLLNLAGQRQQAAALYTKLAETYGDDPVFVSKLGAEAYFADHLVPALALFNKVLESKPDDATALKGSAIILAENNNALAAIERLREYNRRYDDDGDAHYRLAELYTLVGRKGPALNEYKAASRLLKGKLIMENQNSKAKAKSRKDALQNTARPRGTTR